MTGPAERSCIRYDMGGGHAASRCMCERKKAQGGYEKGVDPFLCCDREKNKRHYYYFSIVFKRRQVDRRRRPGVDCLHKAALCAKFAANAIMRDALVATGGAELHETRGRSKNAWEPDVAHGARFRDMKIVA